MEKNAINSSVDLFGLNISSNSQGVNSNQRNFENVLLNLEKNFTTTQNKIDSQVNQLSPQYKTLINLQKSMYQCHLQTEVITKIAESVQATVKKIQNQSS